MSCNNCTECECKSVEPDALELSMSMFATKEDYLQARIAELEEALSAARTSEREGWRYANEVESDRKKLESHAEHQATLIRNLTSAIVDLETDSIEIVKASLEAAAKHANVPYIRAGDECASAIRAITPQSILEGMKK